jgi:hypothetical protein
LGRINLVLYSSRTDILPFSSIALSNINAELHCLLGDKLALKLDEFRLNFGPVDLGVSYSSSTFSISIFCHFFITDAFEKNDFCLSPETSVRIYGVETSFLADN